MKNTYNDFVSSIGNTPLIKLRGPSEKTGCLIYGKAEFLNPGGSVKDRAAWALIKDAEDKKLISKGGTIVEGTAGYRHRAGCSPRGSPQPGDPCGAGKNRW